MQIKISTRHGHLSEETQGHIKEKVEKLLHYFDRITAIYVTVDLHNSTRVVEIEVDAEHKHDFISKAENEDLFAAVDNALEKMEHQIVKYKEKIQDHRRTPPMGDIPKHS